MLLFSFSSEGKRHIGVVDTHPVSHGVGGNGKGLVVWYCSKTRAHNISDLTSWIVNRLNHGGVKFDERTSLLSLHLH